MKNLKFILIIVLLNFAAVQFANASLTVAWNKKVTTATNAGFIIDAVKLSGNQTISLYQNGTSGYGLIRVNASGTVSAGPTISLVTAKSLVLDESAGFIYVIGSTIVSSDSKVCIEKRNATTLALVSQITHNFSSQLNSTETGIKGAVDASHNLYVAGVVFTGTSFMDEICVLKINLSGTVVTNRIRNYQPGPDFVDDCGLMTFNGTTDFYVCGLATRNQSTNPDVVGLVTKFSTVNLGTLWERTTNLNTAIVGLDEWVDMELYNGMVHLTPKGNSSTAFL